VGDDCSLLRRNVRLARKFRLRRFEIRFPFAERYHHPDPDESQQKKVGLSNFFRGFW
jgi:hypothetical protein